MRCYTNAWGCVLRCLPAWITSGSFLPPHKVEKIQARINSPVVKKPGTPRGTPSRARSATPQSTPSTSTPSSKTKANLTLGCRVKAGTRKGVVQFLGKTKFATGNVRGALVGVLIVYTPHMRSSTDPASTSRAHVHTCITDTPQHRLHINQPHVHARSCAWLGQIPRQTVCCTM